MLCTPSVSLADHWFQWWIFSCNQICTSEDNCAEQQVISQFACRHVLKHWRNNLWMRWLGFVWHSAQDRRHWRCQVVQQLEHFWAATTQRRSTITWGGEPTSRWVTSTIRDPQVPQNKYDQIWYMMRQTCDLGWPDYRKQTYPTGLLLWFLMIFTQDRMTHGRSVLPHIHAPCNQDRDHYSLRVLPHLSADWGRMHVSRQNVIVKAEQDWWKIGLTSDPISIRGSGSSTVSKCHPEVFPLTCSAQSKIRMVYHCSTSFTDSP